MILLGDISLKKEQAGPNSIQAWFIKDYDHSISTNQPTPAFPTIPLRPQATSQQSLTSVYESDMWKPSPTWPRVTERFWGLRKSAPQIWFVEKNHFQQKHDLFLYLIKSNIVNSIWILFLCKIVDIVSVLFWIRSLKQTNCLQVCVGGVCVCKWL